MDLINRQMAKGVVWMILFKFVGRGLGLISTIILARLLVPADFGLVAMAMSLIAILELMGAFSFDIVLIHKQDAKRVHYDTAWTFNVLFALFSAVALVALAEPTAAFYSEPRLQMVIYLLAVGIFIQGLQNIGIVDFRKKMQFDRDFRFGLYKKLAGFLVTVPLAFLWQNYWALIAGMLTGRIGGVVLSFIMHDYRPRLTMKASGELFNFSKWLLFNNLISFVRNRSPDFIIGRISGSEALGLYSVSYEISNLPTTELVAPINRAVYPGYAKMSADMHVLRQGFVNVLAMIALFALPAGAGIAVAAEPLVAVFLGPRWAAAAPIIALLALYGATNALLTNVGSVYNAIGRPHYITFQGAVHMLVLVPLLIWMITRQGVMGASWAFLLHALGFLPITYGILIYTIKLRTAQLVGALWRPLLASAVMYGAVTALLAGMAPGDTLVGHIVRLLSCALVGACVYVVVALALWTASGRPAGAESFVLDKMLPRLGFRRGEA